MTACGTVAASRATGLRDDGFGTYAAAQYSASRIPGAKFAGFDNGGHLLVGHDTAVQAEVVALLTRSVGR